ncbi:MAG: M12 family metallo-peptidase [Phycisphaerales bacterium]|nr:hypothetical protein [Planctomycetota bacterium]MCH8509374.1 M12 family metallo-peptidase [Phycisphaerales bacterium]
MRAFPALCLSVLTAGTVLASESAPTGWSQPTAQAQAQVQATIRTVADLVRLADMPMGAQVRLALPVPGGEELLDLTRFTNLAPGAAVIHVDELGHENHLDQSGVVLLRGTLANDPDSMVFLGITPHQVSGFVQSDQGVRVISSGEAGEAGAISAALLEDIRFAPDGDQFCAVDPDNPVFYPNHIIPQRRPTAGADLRGSAPCRVARIAIDTDYEFTANLFGGNPSMSAAYAQILMGAISMIYERDVNVRLQIPYLRVWTTTDNPYQANDGTIGFLFEMRDHWNLNMRHVPREAVQGLSGRGLGGGVAYLNALCSMPWGHGVSANLNGSFPMPVIDNSHQNWDLMVVAHELGHNFGSGHTHDGYNPPIDGCGNSDCSLAPNSTIMSYCHLCPGGLSNIDMRFHPRVQTRMLQFLDGANCDLTAGPEPIARDDSFIVMGGMSTELDVLSNDAAAACDDVTLMITNLPTNSAAGGTLAIVHGENTTFQRVLYTPAPGFAGVDGFTYSTSAGTAMVSIEVEPLRQAVSGVITEPGVDVDYFVLNNPSTMPDYDSMTPYLSDVVPDINFPATNGVFATSGRTNNVGAVFRGVIEVPKTGWYRLTIESDDGSILYMGDEMIIDNDGLHGMQERGAVVALEAGKHPVRIDFFENQGAAGLIARYFGQGLAYQPIPASAWSRIVGSDCPADLAPPYGELNFFDFAAYMALFNAQDPAADLAPPFGEWNFFDVAEYLRQFNAGCP